MESRNKAPWLTAVALGTAWLLAFPTSWGLAFPGGRVGGGGLGSRFGSVSGGRFSDDRLGDEGGFGGRFGGGDGGGLRGLLQQRGAGGERAAGGEGGFLQQRQRGEGQWGQRQQGTESLGASEGQSGSGRRWGSSRGSQTTAAPASGDGHSYDTRGGGTVDTSKTTDGDNTTRDVDYTGADGQSAQHSGTVTKDDGDFSYSGSSSNSAGASSRTTASGTYADGRVTSMDTDMSGQNAAGQTGSHQGDWTRDDGTVTYRGNTQTSTGVNSAAAGWATKTDDGWVAHGAGVDDQGAAAGTAVKDGNQVYARSVTTNGETVNRNYANCEGGDCTRTTVSTTVPPYYPVSVTQYAYYPATYAYYSCPPGGLTVYGGIGGPVYGCGVTPVVSATIPLAAMLAMAHKHSQGSGAPPATAQVTSSPVVMYRVSSDTVVYATSYSPKGLYWEQVKNRSFWVPGAARGTAEVKRDIERASEMNAPTANATVITYTIGDALVYLTNQPPFPGTYSQRSGELYAWMPGVTKPSSSQRDTIETAVTAHAQGGEKALAAQVEKTQQQKPPPS